MFTTNVPGSGTRYEWNSTFNGLGSLAPGGVWTFTVSGKVGEVCGAKAVTSTAYAWVTSGCAAGSGFSNVVGNVVQPRAMTVTAGQTPATLNVGDLFAYRITVANTGTATLVDVTVVDTIAGELQNSLSPGSPMPVTGPSGFNLATVFTTNVPGSGTRYEWNSTFNGLGSLPPGGVWTFTVSGKVGELCTAKTITSTALAFSGCVSTQAAAIGNVVVPRGFTVTAGQTPGTLNVGDLFAYRITVANTGTATLVDVTVVDTIAGELQNSLSPGSPMPVTGPSGFNLATVFTTNVPGSGTRYEWNSTFNGLGSLPPGGVWTFTVSGKVGELCSAKTITSTALAFSGCVTIQAAPVGNLVQPRALTVVKTQTPPSPAVGGPLTYQLVVTNAGSATIQDLTIVDTVSPLLTLASAANPVPFGAPVVTSVPGSGTRYAWTGSFLNFAPGTSFTFTISGTVGAVYSAVTVSNTGFAASGCVATGSNAVSFSLNPVLSISIVSATTYDFFTVPISSVNPSTTTFDILNNGNVPEALALAVTDPAPWTSTNTGTPMAGMNRYELDAQFAFPAAPGSWNPGVHALLTTPDVSTGARFAGPGEDGANVPAGQARHLWVRFLAPALTDQAGSKDMVITISAQAP